MEDRGEEEKRYIDLANDVLIDPETGRLYDRFTGVEVEPPTDPNSDTTGSCSQSSLGFTSSAGSIGSCAASGGKSFRELSTVIAGKFPFIHPLPKIKQTRAR